MTRYLLAAALLLNVGVACAAGVQSASMKNVLADPERFDGQTIRVTGFLRLEFGANALYASRDDFNDSVAAHALGLSLTDAQLRSLSKLNNGRVLVEGTFSSKERGRAGQWPGSLQHIVQVRMWRKKSAGANSIRAKPEGSACARHTNAEAVSDCRH